jgi:hypothetical protein
MGNVNAINKFVFIPPKTSYTTDTPFPITFIKTSQNRKIPAYYLKKKYQGNN